MEDCNDVTHGCITVWPPGLPEGTGKHAVYPSVIKQLFSENGH